MQQSAPRRDIATLPLPPSLRQKLLNNGLHTAADLDTVEAADLTKGVPWCPSSNGDACACVNAMRQTSRCEPGGIDGHVACADGVLSPEEAAEVRRCLEGSAAGAANLAGEYHAVHAALNSQPCRARSDTSPASTSAVHTSHIAHTRSGTLINLHQAMHITASNAASACPAVQERCRRRTYSRRRRAAAKLSASARSWTPHSAAASPPAKSRSSVSRMLSSSTALLL